MTSSATPSGKVSASYEVGIYKAYLAFSTSSNTDGYSWSTWPNGVYGSNNESDFEEIYKGKHSSNADLEEFELPHYSNSYQYLKLAIDSVYDNGAITLDKIEYYGITE